MQHFRPAVVLDLAKNTHQTLYVVTVCRTEITDVKTREDITRLLAQYRFETIVAT